MQIASNQSNSELNSKHMFSNESLSSFVLRLRGKSNKARELALELIELQVPHQEARFDFHHTLAPWHALSLLVSKPCGMSELGAEVPFQRDIADRTIFLYLQFICTS